MSLPKTTQGTITMTELRLALTNKVLEVIYPEDHKHFKEYIEYFTDDDLKNINDAGQYNEIYKHKAEIKATLKGFVGSDVFKAEYIANTNNWATQAHLLIIKRMTAMLDCFDIHTLNAIANRSVDIPSIVKEMDDV